MNGRTINVYETQLIGRPFACTARDLWNTLLGGRLMVDIGFWVLELVGITNLLEIADTVLEITDSNCLPDARLHNLESLLGKAGCGMGSSRMKSSSYGR